MKVLGVIPARYASTRFPGKPLVMIKGLSMIQRVYEQASKSRLTDSVIVATDDVRIEEHVRSFGGSVMMTSTRHSTGTERTGEVLEKLKAAGSYFDVVLNVQGDEPLLEPAQLDELVECFWDEAVQIATLAKRITDPEELFNPNVVKVVRDRKDNALYFSRSVIPFIRNEDQAVWVKRATYLKHIGIYAFRTEILIRLLKLPPETYEQAESLEQLRWLVNGYCIKVKDTDTENIAIDTPEDLLKLTNKI